MDNPSSGPGHVKEDSLEGMEHSINAVLEAVERLGDELASRTPGDLSFRVSVPEDPPTVRVLAELINETGKNLDEHLRKEAGEVQRRNTELSEAYNALQRQNEDMQRDLRMARNIQLRLLPQENDYPDRPELSCHGYYASMQNVGGDLYDIIRIGRNSYGVLMADVSGHGVPAALITSLVKIAFRTRSHWGLDPSEICRLVNEGLHPILSDLDYFVTAYFGIIDLEAGEFRYCNAGHHPALLLRQGHPGIITLDTKGRFLGPFEDAVFESESIRLQEKDSLFLYTDGIVEARNYLDEEFGYERLCQRLLRCRDEAGGWSHEEDRAFGSQAVIDAARREMLDFTMGADQRDDQSMFVVQYHGPLVSSAARGDSPSASAGSPPAGEAGESVGDRAPLPESKAKDLGAWVLRRQTRAALKEGKLAEAGTLVDSVLLLREPGTADYSLAALYRLKVGDKKGALDYLKKAEAAAGDDVETLASLKKFRLKAGLL